MSGTRRGRRVAFARAVAAGQRTLPKALIAHACGVSVSSLYYGTSRSDAALDRLVARAERLLAGLDRHTSPSFPSTIANGYARKGA
jgi:hypothetical protein